MPFNGLKVLSLESRRAREMEALIRREGGDPFIAPSVAERALDDNSEALAFIERLTAGDFDLTVCMTGVGLGFLRDLARERGLLEQLVEGLRRTFILSRGPKPLPVLRELGLKASIVAPEPNTWHEVLQILQSRPERRIAVQEHGRPNPAFITAVEALGAHVETFAVYRWDRPADLEPLREAARRIASNNMDVALFTSSIQLDHLLATADELGLLAQVEAGLAGYTVVASIGPTMTEALEAAGVRPDIVPPHPKMAPLIKAASEGACSALAGKRAT